MNKASKRKTRDDALEALISLALRPTEPTEQEMERFCAEYSIEKSLSREDKAALRKSKPGLMRKLRKIISTR